MRRVIPQLALLLAGSAALADERVVDGFKGCVRTDDGRPVCRSVATGTYHFVTEEFFYRYVNPPPAVVAAPPPPVSENAPVSPVAAAPAVVNAAPVAAATVSPPPTQASPDLSAADLYEHASKSIVYVISVADEDSVSQGSGVVVRPSIVATNCHVLKDVTLSGVFYGGKLYKYTTLVGRNEDRDLCILRVEGLTAPPIAMGSVDRLRVGDRVFAIGSPRGLQLTLSEGLVSGLRKSDDVYPYVQTSAPISPGSSGGALISSTGELIGITSFIYRDSQNLNFAAPVDWLHDFAAVR